MKRPICEDIKLGIEKPYFTRPVKKTKNENNAFLPWAFTGGLGASQMLKKHKKDLKTCPLKCPTFREAQKVS